MHRNASFFISLAFCFLSVIVNAQEHEPNKISLSIAWAPEYYGPNDGKFRFDAVDPITFESLVNFRPFKKLSFSSGVGYNRHTTEMQSWLELSVWDYNKSMKWIINEIRIPVQVQYHFSDGNGNIDTYIKTEFRNEFTFSEMNYYDLGELVSTRSNSWYTSSIGIGIGSILRADKAIGILIEGSLGTALDKHYFFEAYIMKIKLGVVIQ